VVVSLLGTLLAGRYWKEGERRMAGVRVEGFQMDEGEDGTDVVRAACGSFVMPRTRAALLHSEGWGGVDEWETMIERALEWLTISMRALPTSLTVVSGTRWLVNAQRADLQ